MNPEHATMEAAMVRMRAAAVLQEQAENAQAEKERAQKGLPAWAENAQMAAFKAKVMGHEVGGALAEALAAADYQDAVETQQRTRCHNILDGWISNQGGSERELRELLGTHAHAVRADMEHQRQDLRQRALRAEQEKTELERLVERQGNQIAHLHSEVDRLVTVLAERGY